MKLHWRTTHGESKTPLYRVWSAMKQRCESAANDSYARYGGRGIKVCVAWANYVPFRNWALSAGYAKGLNLDRRNNDGDYEPSNCQWILPAVNGYNRCDTKLNPAKVKFIRGMLEQGSTCRRLASMLGVHEHTVSEIKCGRKWKSVPA